MMRGERRSGRVLRGPQGGLAPACQGPSQSLWPSRIVDLGLGMGVNGLARRRPPRKGLFNGNRLNSTERARLRRNPH
jgi:hypothetical protein